MLGPNDPHRRVRQEATRVLAESNQRRRSQRCENLALSGMRHRRGALFCDLSLLRAEAHDPRASGRVVVMCSRRLVILQDFLGSQHSRVNGNLVQPTAQVADGSATS